LILLSTEPQRLLETILSRCLRLNFGAVGAPRLASEQATWLEAFGQEAANDKGGLLSRYRLLDFVMQRLTAFREAVEKTMSERSPLAQYEDVESDLRKQWEDELNAAVEAEYRLKRMELLAGIQWWMRDVWLRTMRAGDELLFWPQSQSASKVADRISARQAEENLRSLEGLQRLLHTNVQESLALEVGLLKLHF
jgi:DNA polymerase-3 subunit delta'